MSTEYKIIDEMFAVLNWIARKKNTIVRISECAADSEQFLKKNNKTPFSFGYIIISSDSNVQHYSCGMFQMAIVTCVYL